MLKYFIVAISLFLSLVGCTHKKEQKETPPPVPVTALHIEPQTIPADFYYVGVAESSHVVELRARVEGYLEKISYEEGGLVKRGEEMFTLDQRPFLDTLKSKEGDLARQAAILWNARQTRKRMVPLYQKNAVSQRDLDNAVARELSAIANVKVAEANVEAAEVNLSYTVINAPVTGMASQAKYREGALIEPGEQNLLTTIYVIDPIWVNFSVSEADILKGRKEVQKGQLSYPPNMDFKIDIQLADGSILPAQGKIDFADPAVQQNTGTTLVRAILPNHKGLLRPGQFARVIVKGATRENAIIVPQEAVAQGQSGIYVYVINDSGQAEVRPIVPGDWYKDYWVINKGLKQGDRVIVKGINRVQNGTDVHITAWASPLPAQKNSGIKQEQRLGL